MADTLTDNVPTTDLFKLHAAITDMDALAQAGFSEIASTCKLALAWLELPASYGHINTLADALAVIWGKAEETENCINSLAEENGCNWKDDSRARRYAAESAYREGKKI